MKEKLLLANFFLSWRYKKCSGIVCRQVRYAPLRHSEIKALRLPFFFGERVEQEEKKENLDSAGERQARSGKQRQI